MEQTHESKTKKKNGIAWKPLAAELGRALLLGVAQGLALGAGGKLLEVSLRRRATGEVVSINRKAL